MAGMDLYKLPLLGQVLARRAPVDRRRSFSLTPIRNPLADWGPQEGGPVSIKIPLQHRPAPRVLVWLAGKLARTPPPDKRTLELDPVGSFVWRAANGQHTVRQLIWLLAAEYRLNRKDAEVALLEFMRQLSSRNLIGFADAAKTTPVSPD